MDESGRDPDREADRDGYRGRWQPSELLLVALTALLLLVVVGAVLAVLRVLLDIRLTRVLLTALLAIVLYRPIRNFVVARWPESEGLFRVHEEMADRLLGLSPSESALGRAIAWTRRRLAALSGEAPAETDVDREARP